MSRQQPAGSLTREAGIFQLTFPPALHSTQTTGPLENCALIFSKKDPYKW